MDDKNWELIKAIIHHQNNEKVHPLTCGNDSNHEILIPAIKNNKVVLVCINCNYIQYFIPKCIL